MVTAKVDTLGRRGLPRVAGAADAPPARTHRARRRDPRPGPQVCRGADDAALAALEAAPAHPSGGPRRRERRPHPFGDPELHAPQPILRALLVPRPRRAPLPPAGPGRGARTDRPRRPPPAPPHAE